MSEQLPQLPPIDWKTAILGQVSECILGGTPSTEVPHFWGGDIPWMASGDVHIRRIHDVPGRITALGLRSSNATLTNPPAVAVGLAGQGKTRGTVALTLCTLSTNQSIALLRANGSDLRTDYLFHNLDRRYEELRARSSGGGRGGLSKAILEAVPIDLPPLIEQGTVAQILDTLDTAICETEAIIVKLKAVKQGLLHDLLTRGIDANGELRPPQVEAPHLYKDSPLGWIPQEWAAETLSKSIGLVSGQHIQSELCNSVGKGVPYFTGPSDFLGAETVVTQYTIHPQVMCDEADVLITVKGSGCGKVAVAGVRACISRQLMAIQVSAQALQYWLAVFQSQQEPFNRMATGGNIPGISRAQILELLVAMPTEIEEMTEIGDRIQAMNARLASEECSLGKLQLKKVGLMDDLLTGRVRVTPLLTPAEQEVAEGGA